MTPVHPWHHESHEIRLFLNAFIIFYVPEKLLCVCVCMSACQITAYIGMCGWGNRGVSETTVCMSEKKGILEIVPYMGRKKEESISKGALYG